MAVCCSHCGKALLRENARFCSHCGMALSPSSSMHQQRSQDTVSPSWLENTDKRKRVVLHEQIAQQPFSHSQSQPTTQTILKASQRPAPVTPIPVSIFEEETDAPLQKEPLSIFVVRENTPRPVTLVLPSLQRGERPEREIEDVPSHISKKSSMAQLGKKPQSQRVSSPSINSTRRLSWLEVVCILSVFLIVSGALIWFLYISSTNSAITNPVQNFTDSDLGIALQYPNQWIEASDSGQSTISLYDNGNHTTQIIVGRYGANMDTAQFMQKQALQFGMTKGQFGAAISFASATWQQLQGHRVEKGADYLGVIFATLHNHHLYMIAQFAPQGVYATEEKLIFTPLRTSFRFL